MKPGSPAVHGHGGTVGHAILRATTEVVALLAAEDCKIEDAGKNGPGVVPDCCSLRSKGVSHLAAERDPLLGATAVRDGTTLVEGHGTRAPQLLGYQSAHVSTMNSVYREYAVTVHLTGEMLRAIKDKNMID